MTPKQDERLKKLYKLGLMFNGSALVYKDINFHWTDTLCMTDEKFDKAYEGAVKRKKTLDEEEDHGRLD